MDCTLTVIIDNTVVRPLGELLWVLASFVKFYFATFCDNYNSKIFTKSDCLFVIAVWDSWEIIWLFMIRQFTCIFEQAVVTPQAQVFIAAYQHRNQTLTVHNNLFVLYYFRIHDWEKGGIRWQQNLQKFWRSGKRFCIRGMSSSEFFS